MPGGQVFFFPPLFFQRRRLPSVRNKAAAAAKAEAAKGFVTDPGAAKLAVQDPNKDKNSTAHSPTVSRSNSESRAGLTESSFRDRLGEEQLLGFLRSLAHAPCDQDLPRFAQTRLY
jgi:hypothetical protein